MKRAVKLNLSFIVKKKGSFAKSADAVLTIGKRIESSGSVKNVPTEQPLKAGR